MKMWEILVPTDWNDGDPIPVGHHKVWDAAVRAISGGLTIMRPAKGQWIRSDGSLQEEHMIPVRFAVDDDVQAWVVMRLTLKHYDQEAVTCYRVSDFAVVATRAELLGKDGQ